MSRSVHTSTSDFDACIVDVEMERYADFINFAHRQFDRVTASNFSVALLNRLLRDLLRLRRLMSRFRYHRRNARAYLRHLRGLAVLQSRHQFLLGV